MCTGTIISDRHVFTAAHCFPEYIGRRYSGRRNQAVVVGLHGVDKSFANEKTNINVHPKYDCRSGFPGYDVAIVELLTPITFSESDQPICIVDSFRENIGEMGYVVGYGASSVNGTVPLPGNWWNVTYNDPDEKAYENFVEFRTVERCASVKRPLGSITRHSEKTICAVGNKRDTAKGDSGGPLMINRKGVWYQVGVTSIGSMFEDDDGDVKWFSLYSRLSRACDWIEEVTSGYVKCALMDG